MTVSTTTTAVSAAGDGSTTDFTFTFEILAAEDLKVIVVTDSTGAESEKTLTTDYTVAGVGQVSGGTVTFVTAPDSGETVHIKRGNMALTQPTNYTPNDPFPAETHENALDRMALQIQQINEKVGRAVVRSETDSASAQLPTNETLKGKTLAFNETTGAVEAGPSIADVGTVSGIAADIATLADIEDGTDATDAIQTVASISGDVTTVSGISSDVTNVSNNAASVSTVAGDSANISTVAGNISDVATVSSNITSVSTVASNISDVVTVANDLNEAISEVETVANDLNEAVSEIDTVATSISSVQTVGTNISNVNTVAGIDSDVTTVSGISGNVTTVAGISSDVTTVSGVSADVSTVSGVSANVTTVAGISSDVTTVAGNSANVTTVATDITNVNTVASNIADVNNFALTYRIAASAPATSLDEGDLYFDTTQNQMFVYDGSAWASVSPDLVGDTTPQLGGNLDLNGNDITGTGNINNTGTITTDGLTVDGASVFNQAASDQSGGAAVKANGTAYGTNKSIHAYMNTSNAAKSLIYAENGAGSVFNVDGAGDISFYDSTGTTQGFFWDASRQELGIGTTSTSRTLTVHGNDGVPLQLQGSGNDTAIAFAHSGTINSAINSSSDGAIEFRIGGISSSDEAARIDSSQNLLVGKTSAATSTAGVQLASNGRVEGVVDGGEALRLNRITSDGKIAVFRKDNSEVGSIGTEGGDLTIGTGDTGVQFNDAGDAVRPWTISGNTARDNAIDIGTSSYRFKDLYLSGNANVGDLIGPASANFDIKTGSGTGDMIFYTNGGERARIDASGNVGIGTTSPAVDLEIRGSGSSGQIYLGGSTDTVYSQIFSNNDGIFIIDADKGSAGADPSFRVKVNDAEALRIDSSRRLLVGKTTASSTGTGHLLHPNSASFAGRDNGIVYAFNRNGTDGGVIQIMNSDVVEGTISVSGTTVTYGGGHLARWSRLPDDSKDTSIVKGTVMTNLDAMVEWGDEDNEQLNKTAVSSVEGDVNVAGVFVSWDDDDDWNDFYVAMTGDMIIRIASGTTVARGDLLMSAGDGTAKPQGDDIVRSKTIAKVTSTNVSHTYDDGSYCVPCVLMAC